jgi:hypothetical protein
MTMRKLHRTPLTAITVAALLLAALVPLPADACPFCPGPTLTLAEQYSKADAAVLARWLSGAMPTREKLGKTSYEIAEVARTPLKSISKGTKITVERYYAGKPGDLSLFFGTRTKAETLEWGSPLNVTDKAYRYVVEAPAADAQPEKRLAYYLKFLEHPDRMIAADAFGEFSNARYEDIVPLAKEFPRDELRQWIVDPNIHPSRLGLYGMMLGLCGNDEDAALMEARITDSTDGIRVGIEGLMGGYLLLTGEKGLATIDKSKLQDKEVLFTETYSAIQALRFVWTYGNGRISAERLRKSMRLLLDRPELIDLVITDLGRWKDWSVQRRLMEMYGAEEYNLALIKRAIIRYMIASTKDIPASSEKTLPRHVTEGTKYLRQLRDKDPKLVEEVERYFFLQ